MSGLGKLRIGNKEAGKGKTATISSLACKGLHSNNADGCWHTPSARHLKHNFHAHLEKAIRSTVYILSTT
jgi:hypothetical protein